MSDPLTPDAPVPPAPAPPAADAPAPAPGTPTPAPGAPAPTPPDDGSAGPVVTVGRSVGLAVLAMLVAFGLSLLIAPPIAERICDSIEPNSGDPVGDIFAAAIGCLVAVLVVFVLLYLVLLVTLLFAMSVAGWAVWGRRTFIWTLVSGVGLTVVAVVIMGILGD